MIRSAFKKKSASFISLIFILTVPGIALICLEPAEVLSDSTSLLHSNKIFYDIMKIAIPTTIFSGILLIAVNEDIQVFFTDRWTRFTSPNHAAPDQYRPFYIKPFSEEAEQETQCDKGVHFIFSYLPVIPLATIIDRTYYLSTAGKVDKEISKWSIASSALIISGFAILEEYMDGHQKQEGFSFYDLTANFSAIALSIMKHYGYMDYLTFYWSFNRDMFQSSEQSKRWPWWVYMRGYEFYANIEVLSLIENIKVKKDIFSGMLETIGYVPDLKGFWRLRYN